MGPSIITFVLLLLAAGASHSVSLEVDFSLPGDKIVNFWSSTGLTPQDACEKDMVEEQLLSQDMDTNIILIGSLPNHVIKQVAYFQNLRILIHIMTSGLLKKLKQTHSKTKATQTRNKSGLTKK